MAGETQQMHTVKELDAESKQKDEGTVLEKQSDKTTKSSSEHLSTKGTEAGLSTEGTKTETLEKEKDYPQQREAVIRPQQTGKIDFSSLQNRSKFVTDRTWSAGKGSPQSPSGKSRSREKGKRSGKTERGNPQQLYRLSITNPRTIGIAYPQQKVLPPKKLEPSRGPVSGSYSFNVPIMPERKVELQQQELSYSHYFQENPSNIISPSYTSQALGSSSGTSSHLHPPLSQQQASMESKSTQPGSQLIISECPLTGSNVWQSPEQSYSSANYGISSQKSTALSETSNTSTFVPSQFQYGYNLLEQSNPESFASDQNLQPHITHSSFSFSSGNGQNSSQNSSPFNIDHQSDRSSYSNPEEPQFIQGVASSIQCSRTVTEDSPSSDSSGSSSQQSEQGKTALPVSSDTSSQADCQDAAITSGRKRNCHPKDAAASQRTLIQAGVPTRNISQTPGSPMHFTNRTFNNPVANSITTGATPFDKSISTKVVSRPPHSWEGPNKTYSTADQNTVQYPVMSEKFQFQNQTAIDHRPNSSKNNRVPWQHMRPNSAMPNLNRIDSSRQINNQKMAYMVSPADWQDESEVHKHNLFQSTRSSGVLLNQKHENIKQNNSAVSAFKLEMTHTQLCEAKNKSVYFGLNQTTSTAKSRNYSYPPPQVPPMGLLKVSPYESPLPSPVHNPQSSSTCSSLSPTSTSPINMATEDGPMSKTASHHLFYQEPQAKAKLQSDHMSTHSQPFPSDIPRSLPYMPDRTKDNTISYLQNGTHPKTPLDSSKDYMDSFGVEHHQPPPPYSAHPLLSSSLATANLDQLDVLLTCKQCDQNFSNLVSFLGHKQYCTQNTLAQNELKDLSKMEENRKFQVEPVKAALAMSNTSLSRCPSDLHLSLLGLNKNGELISESEGKGDNKDDLLKLGLLSGPNTIPISLPELEMEDAKLDSLITEALNGLGYQSDNAEIDSSFIDAFVDDDLITVKTSSTKQSLKAKESTLPPSKNKHGADKKLFAQEKCYDSDSESKEKKAKRFQKDEKDVKKDGYPKNSKEFTSETSWEQESKVNETGKMCKSGDNNMSPERFLLSGKFSQHCGLKSFQDSPALRGSAASQASTSPTSRAAAKESKRKSTGGGTWSKELIHKIVQQKNKLHKLHVKGTKNLQFSLVMERLTPAVQNPAVGEYDYVSDSEDECEPVKIASQGRLNQSSRCKYTYTKQCKWRARSEREQAAWRHKSKECIEMKKSEELSLTPEKHQRLRRRGSRSSTSSELSTSVSPKSADRTDSDNERKNESPEQKKHNKSTPQKLFKESSTLALTFTKSVKKYNIDKTTYSDNKGITEDPQKFSNPEVPDLLTSPQKGGESVRNYEKRRTSQAKSRDKLVPRKKESSVGNTLKSMDKPDSTTDNKTVEVESSSSGITGEADFNVDKNTKNEMGEGPKATQLQLSGTATLEKQSENACMVKEAIILVNDLDVHRPTSLCTSLMDEMCLSPTGNHSPLIQKDALHLMPYPMDQEQGLIKSPLSFDTASMFGDLGGFDSGLYSELPIQKDSFHSVESTADKKELFVSSFSPFIEQRDWNLIVNPMLRNELSQYKGISEKSNEKKTDYAHIPLSLPEKIIDYSANLSSCASEDELEIKRIVNELENQLQTNKMETLALQQAPKQLQISKFSSLRIAENSECESKRLNIKCSDQTVNHSEILTQSDLPWSSTFQFDLGENHSPHTQIHGKEAELHSDQKLDQRKVEKETPAETKEDILEQRRYTENLMKSLEVISDSIFQKEPVVSEKEPNVNSPSQRHEQAECQAPDAAEREACYKKEAINRNDSVLSFQNIIEQQHENEIILDESQISVHNDTDPSSESKKPVTLQQHESTNNEQNARTKVASDVISASCSVISERENFNSLTENKSDCREVCEEPEAAEQITYQTKSQHSSPAPGDPTEENGQKMADVIKADLEQQYTNDITNHENISASQAVELKIAEITETSKQGNLIAISSSENLSSSNAYCKSNVSLDMVNKDKPCNLGLFKTNPERCGSPLRDSQSAEGQSNLLILSQSDDIIYGNSCKVTQFNEPLKTEAGLVFAKQEKILNVQDIKDHLPVDFMASQQNSPCRKADEEIPCTFLDTASPPSPILSSHQTPTQNCDSKTDLLLIGNDSIKLIDQCPQNAPSIKDNKEATNNNSIEGVAEMDSSLMSSPSLEFTMISSTKTVSLSPVPERNTAEPPKVIDKVEKVDQMYDLKLSPLNYYKVSDEPPQLNQYDYIPISPADKPEEDPVTKPRPTESCESCDLSINPTLILNQTDTETVPQASDAVAKIQQSNDPLVLQESMKFSCFSFGLTSDIPKSQSSDDNTKISLQVFPDPDQPVKDLCIQADLQTEVPLVSLDSHKCSFEDNAHSKKADPPLICENERVPLPPEIELKIKGSPCLTGQQTQKETIQKNSQSSNPENKVLCEICFMCFRTVPGLKRHKAMKHTARPEKCTKNSTASNQGTEEPVKKLRDDSQKCFTATKKEGLPEISDSLTSKTTEMESALKKMATSMSSVTVDEISHQKPLLQTKAKKNNKGRKNKISDRNADPFSDELLKILKTDILQAITPEFKSSVLQEQSKHPEEKMYDRVASETEEFLHQVAADLTFKNTTQTLTEEQKKLSETVAHNQFGETKMTAMAYLETCTERNVESAFIENEINGSFVESDSKAPEDSLALEILRNVSTDMKCTAENLNSLSCLNSSPPSSPSISSDLRAILDDDTTFSQLFPRDEEAKRKKCSRVYGKRNKRQKLSIPSDVAADNLPPETFKQNKDRFVEGQSGKTISDPKSNPCEYETISIDDAIMLNMCHNSTLKADDKPVSDVKQNSQEDNCELGSNLLSPFESNVTSTAKWSSPSGFTSFNSCPVVTSEPSDCKHKDSLPATSCTVEPHAGQGPQSFQTIDIQNINTTFQLPEMQFLNSGIHIQDSPPPEAADEECKEDEKSKKETERRGRKRQDGGMKVKDKQYKCKVCFTWFLTLGELNFHKLSHNPSPPPTCYMCVQRKFSSREQLRDHLREKHAKNKTGIWTCGMCLKEISDVWMYNEHLREHATQFARRGQTQGSMLGISGCLMQETAVKNFISSIMQQRPSKANRESSKASKEQDKAATGEGAETKANKTKTSSGGGGKQTTLTPVEVLHKTETPKSVEMHPNCKDPSRDCHHCGKQFPKPFKLQRHLVVHNLERIFLCHKCPVSYQEAQELKEHLRSAHEEMDDLDSKHTTLYTCELCADVMHVIKKSFICSTCNYTFSKKEQFDRHMEKHLSGSNKIFKFRGVLRPVKVSASKESECDSPASKKKRLLSDSLPENSSDSGIASLSSIHLNQNADTQSSNPCVPTADDATQTIPNEYQDDSSNANVKTEDITADCSQMLKDLENCIHLSSSGSTAAKEEEPNVTLLPNLDKEGNEKTITESCDVKEENELVCIRTEANSCTVYNGNTMEEEVVKDKTDLPPAVFENSFVCSTENQNFLQTPESVELAVDETTQQGNDEQRDSTLSCNDTKQQALSHGAEQESCSQIKNNAAPATPLENTKISTGSSCAKAMEATPSPQSKLPIQALSASDDKEFVKLQKRRKDMKSAHMLQRVSSLVTQENFTVDSKPKKKFRPSKCANPSLQRRSEGANEYPVLSSVRDDVVGNKIISKCKNVNLSLQARKGLLESCVPKKPDIITPQNGEYKAKRGPLGRSGHSPVSKVPTVPINNSLNKLRPKMGVRTLESNSYRTAESQNHILSQLFGQKLTSFKIPLRKDTSESIN
ncbi:zinc finger protein 469 [Cyprinodon tularosa]|uniref:zinc finger protein 469 n=1 Tax=Cyprinodon tularosa TaxID=77115 RepID=UPI0018E2709D|nr:zinc finger protein 469 [Cyprinodon tularosa]XP_038155986.1 zinc finger protein 469 [Cyprinodon tularosa]XP_038155987.1 zinc finger protein 469 [Cyprinodon tularosa]